jgi:FKBP-type peptidyl-prolyl cis-trans isomerase 2
MKEELTIAQHKVITMQYSLCNTDGVIIRDANGEPVSYLMMPLENAGQSLLFEVKIQGIRAATEEEIRNGKITN